MVGEETGEAGEGELADLYNDRVVALISVIRALLAAVAPPLARRRGPGLTRKEAEVVDL